MSSVAYVDRDWLGSPDVPVLAFRERTLAFDGRRADVPSDVTPEQAAFAALAGVAEAAVEAVGKSAEPAAVLGAGLVARLLRQLLGRDDALEGARVAFLATREAGALRRALSSLAPGGRVVLLGERVGPVLVDLYSTVHLRGLEVVGAPGPLSAPVAWGSIDSLDWLQPEDAPSAAEANGTGLWYRIPWPEEA